jgi:hypothetical protein
MSQIAGIDATKETPTGRSMMQGCGERHQETWMSSLFLSADSTAAVLLTAKPLEVLVGVKGAVVVV